MRAEELRDLARRAANRTGYRQILVLGSQAVHGALLEAAFGMGSPYHQSFGVYADGIALSEVTLPDGWQGRVRTQQIDDNTVENPVTLLSPEIHDLCASKLTVAVTGGFGRRSDREFVRALVQAELVDLATLHDRIGQLPSTLAPEVRDTAHAIVHSLDRGNP